MSRGPIFRRKRNAPERRPRGGKFQTNFRFARSHRPQENYVAFLLFFRAIVFQVDHASAGDPRRKQDQRAVSIDRERFGLFLKWFSLRIISANAHGNLHEDALTPASRDRIRGWI